MEPDEIREQTYNALENFHEWLRDNLPAGRAKAIALTKMDETRMWAIEALNTQYNGTKESE